MHPARNARFLIASQSIGTLASVYPYRSHRAIPDISSEYEISQSLPISTPDLSGHAFALPEYYAPCYPSNGSLLFIISRLSQNAKNILGEDNEPPSHVNHFSEWSSERFGAYHRGSHAASEQMIINGDKESIEKVEVEGGMVLKWKQSGQATFSVQEWPLSPSPVSRPRVALIGNLTLISDVWSSSNSPDHRTMVDDDNELDEIEKCYLAYHLDSRRWLPGKGGFHVSCFLRLLDDDSCISSYSFSCGLLCGC